MQNQVGRCGNSHVDLDRVLDGSLGHDLTCGDALINEVHDLLTCLICNQVDLAADGAGGGVVRHGHTERFCHHAHAVCGGHRSAAAANAPRVLDQSVVLVHVHQTLGGSADLVLCMDVQNFLALVDTKRHVTAGDDDRGDVQTCTCHQIAGNDGVAGAEQNHTVEEVSVHGHLNLVGNGVTRRNLDVLGVLQHHAVADPGGHDFQRQTACLANALLDSCSQLVEMYMSGVVLIPGVDDADQRTVDLFLGIAHAVHQAAAAFFSFAEFPAAAHIFILFLFKHCFVLLQKQLLKLGMRM